MKKVLECKFQIKKIKNILKNNTKKKKKYFALNLSIFIYFGKCVAFCIFVMKLTTFACEILQKNKYTNIWINFLINISLNIYIQIHTKIVSYNRYEIILYI